MAVTASTLDLKSKPSLPQEMSDLVIVARRLLCLELGSTRNEVNVKRLDVVRGRAGRAMFVPFACCVF